ncbi:hypothetical protein TB1_022223 [Malus domestica]
MSSWKLIEDVTLCECWVHTTHDSITGNEMDKREIWSKITKAFCDVHGNDARTSQGLQGRWKKLNASFTCWKNAISHASDTTSSSILQFKEPEQIIQKMGMLGNCQRLP